MTPKQTLALIRLARVCLNDGEHGDDIRDVIGIVKEQRDLLKMIATRALSPQKLGDTDHMVQRVPAGLIEQAKAMIGLPD